MFCVIVLFFVFFFFFFQAEDGIRDLYVTGVQTCALPIWELDSLTVECAGDCEAALGRVQDVLEVVLSRSGVEWPGLEEWRRSEERRVGKECRSRWWPDH